MDADALRLSLWLATLATAILLAVGVPVAQWLATSRSRVRFLVEAIVALPLVLPPTVLGFYLLFALGPRSPLGRGWETIFGSPFPFSFGGLLLASVLYSLPFAVQPVAAALAAVDPRLVEAAHTLGASRLATFFRVNLPLAWHGVVSGAVLAFAHTLGEFGVVLMVGGNVRGETRTLSIALYDHVQALEYDAANRTALVLVSVSFAVLLLVYGLQRRPLARWTTR
jgi:molybdate transport system permease protein